MQDVLSSAAMFYGSDADDDNNSSDDEPTETYEQNNDPNKHIRNNDSKLKSKDIISPVESYVSQPGALEDNTAYANTINIDSNNNMNESKKETTETVKLDNRLFSKNQLSQLNYINKYHKNNGSGSQMS